jgi:hypothetical protein
VEISVANHHDRGGREEIRVPPVASMEGRTSKLLRKRTRTEVHNLRRNTILIGRSLDTVEIAIASIL